MTMIDKVRSEMMAAMKAKDKDRKDALSALLSALKAKAIDSNGTLTDEDAVSVVAKEIKQLNETIDSAPESYEKLKKERQDRISVLSEFLPKQMNDEEIKDTIKKVLSDLNIDLPAPNQKGLIMKNLMPLVKGKADGKRVNELLNDFFK